MNVSFIGLSSSVCVRRFAQTVSTESEAFASTPVLQTVKLMFSLAVISGWQIRVSDISTAFLHAPVQVKAGASNGTTKGRQTT